MKKIFTLLLLLATVLPSLAQYQTPRSRSRYNHANTPQYFGIRLGMNIACINSDVVDVDMDSRTGVAVGAVYGLQLSNSSPIWLETGAFYSEKGGQSYHQSTEIKSRLSYLQIPIVIKYSFDVYDDLYIQPLLGGYLSYGIGGKTKNYTTREAPSSYNTFNRFDGGLRVGCGIEYSMVYAEIGYEFGLANIYDDNFTTARNQNFFMNIGVNF